MGGLKIPGPLCQVRNWFADDVDEGTMARVPSPRPGPIRILPEKQQGAKSLNAKSPRVRVTGWPSQLRWDQYRPVEAAPDGSNHGAKTAISLITPKELPTQIMGTQVGLGPFDMAVQLDGSKTWVIKEKQIEALLRHEQVHWDIAGLLGHEMAHNLEALRGPTRRHLNDKVKSELKSIQKKFDEYQDKYDRETESGSNAAKQAYWEDWVNNHVKNGYEPLPDLSSSPP